MSLFRKSFDILMSTSRLFLGTLIPMRKFDREISSFEKLLMLSSWDSTQLRLSSWQELTREASAILGSASTCENRSMYFWFSKSLEAT